MSEPVVLEHHDLQVLLSVAREYLRAFTEDSQPLPEGYEYRDVRDVVAREGWRAAAGIPAGGPAE